MQLSGSAKSNFTIFDRSPYPFAEPAETEQVPPVVQLRSRFPHWLRLEGTRFFH